MTERMSPLEAQNIILTAAAERIWTLWNLDSHVAQNKSEAQKIARAIQVFAGRNIEMPTDWEI